MDGSGEVVCALEAAPEGKVSNREVVVEEVAATGRKAGGSGPRCAAAGDEPSGSGSNAGDGRSEGTAEAMADGTAEGSMDEPGEQAVCRIP